MSKKKFIYRSSVGSNRSDYKQEIEGDDKLKEEGLHGANRRHGDPAREEWMVYALEGVGCAD